MPFDSFDWIFDLTVENTRIRAEREKARALHQEIELREKLDLFFEWCQYNGFHLNGSVDDLVAQFKKFLDGLDGKMFEMECPGCRLVVKAPTKKGILQCPRCGRKFYIDAKIALADASEDRPEDTAS